MDMKSYRKKKPIQKQLQSNKNYRKKIHQRMSNSNSSNNLQNIESPSTINDTTIEDITCSPAVNTQSTIKNVLIVGDSMVQKIEAYRMKKSTKSNISVKSISGATSDGMQHHVRGCLADFQADKIIINCGANDISNKVKPEKIFVNIKEISKICGEDKEVMISGIITREDKYNKKIDRVNNLSMEYCENNNLLFINNNNITQDMLNRGKLHLRKIGITQLVKNFREAINL